MITKERLKELIKNKGKIYGIGKSNNVFCVGLKFREPYSQEWLEGKFEIYSKFFETKEEAEWYKEFGCIERTERLELPTWEEFIEMEEFCFFQKNHKQTIIRILGTKYLGVETTFERYYTGDLNQENYYEACKLAKSLFLGENK